MSCELIDSENLEFEELIANFYMAKKRKINNFKY